MQPKTWLMQSAPSGKQHPHRSLPPLPKTEALQRPVTPPPRSSSSETVREPPEGEPLPRRHLPKSAFFLAEPKARAILEQKQKDVPFLVNHIHGDIPEKQGKSSNEATSSSDEEITTQYPFLPKDILKHRLRYYEPIREGIYSHQAHRKREPHRQSEKPASSSASDLCRTGTRLDYFTSGRRHLFPEATHPWTTSWDAFSFIRHPEPQPRYQWNICHRKTVLPMTQALHLAAWTTTDDA